jgi:hypothetical protein
MRGFAQGVVWISFLGKYCESPMFHVEHCEPGWLILAAMFHVEHFGLAAEN